MWPENRAAIDLFRTLKTQWRMGMNGCTGLDHNVLHTKLNRMGLSADEYDLMEADVFALELAALAAMHEKT